MRAATQCAAGSVGVWVVLTRTVIIVLASAGAVTGSMPGAMLGALAAQENPNTFSLPQATPTPTPTPSSEPQGPLDERSGVLIRPRTIQPEDVLAQPPTPAAPTPTPTSAASPADGAEAQPSASPATRTGETPDDVAAQIDALAATREPENALSETQDAPNASQGDAQGGAQVDTQAYAQDPFAEPQLGGAVSNQTEGSDGYVLGEGDWVDVTPSPQIDLGQRRPAPQFGQSAASRPDPYTPFLLVLVAVLIVILGLVVWRFRKGREQQLALPDDRLARGLRQELWETYHKPSENEEGTTPVRPHRPAPPPDSDPAPAPGPASAPAPTPASASSQASKAASKTAPNLTPQASPPAARSAEANGETATTTPRLGVSIQITSATRSVMQFVLEFRLTIANRSDKAVRDLSVSGQLASAQRGASNAASLARGQSLGEIARIGPQQSHTVEVSLELPMVDVRMLRQGAVSVFIPLVHITIEGTGERARSSSFVIGTPSGSSKARLHPIPLDTSPGAIKGLLANPIKPPPARSPEAGTRVEREA
ncbi:MAG: hypothetical protein AAF559_05165 [Pseudomonadota bacterium]